jgi:hypothetical protein
MRDIPWRSLTGIQIGPVGLSWQLNTPAHEVVRQFLIDLADRRVLFAKGCGSDRIDMIRSVGLIREAVTSALRQLPPKSGPSSSLELIRSECHKFQTRLEVRGVDSITGKGPEEDLFLTLGQFRSAVGFALSALAVTCEIDLPADFESILPSPRVYWPLL